MLDHRLSGACGAQDCQALTTRRACDHGQLRKNSTRVRRLCVPNVNRGRDAEVAAAAAAAGPVQSLWLRELQVSVLPLAVTTSSDRRLSLVRP